MSITTASFGAAIQAVGTGWNTKMLEIFSGAILGRDNSVSPLHHFFKGY